MTRVLLHFAGGTMAGLVVFLVVTRLSGALRFSLPSGALVVGIACAALAHFVSPWATPVVVLLYALASLDELRRERAAARGAARRPPAP